MDLLGVEMLVRDLQVLTAKEGEMNHRFWDLEGRE